MGVEERMDRKKINIGTYYLAPYASTEEHVKDLAECGIDMIVNMRNDKAALDLFSKYGVGAMVTGILPGWFGGNGSNAGTMSVANPMEKYEQASIGFTDHPAIWGIDTGDEPSALDFPYYGQIFDRVREGFPGKIPYLNIYPSYGVKGSNTPLEIDEQLGVEDYPAYIRSFCENVVSDYICFDYYLYSADLSGLYESLCVVSKACQKYERQMWIVLQVNSHQEDTWISTDQLRFQAYSAMAFGAEVIIWACYCAGWWYNHVLDKQGNKTPQYEKLKTVNAEVHALSDEYMKYTHAETYFVGDFSEEEVRKTDKSVMCELNTDRFKELKVTPGHKLIVGLRRYDHSVGEKKEVKEALMICSADDPYDKQSTVGRISFCAKGKVRALGRSDMQPLIQNEDGSYSLEIRPNEGILIVEE